jgi:hypothetical protein
MTASPPLPAQKNFAAANPLSKVLDDLRHDMPAEGMLTTGTLVEILRERGIGALMVLFALPLALPSGIVPGLNTLFALPLAFLTAQQAAGRQSAWLPRKMMEKELDPERMAGLIAAILPWLLKLEKLLRPRLAWVTMPGTARIFGGLALIMALFACIPVPLTHTVPGIGLLLIAGGITQRDGLAVIAGAAIGTAYIIILVGAIAILGPHAMDMIHHMIHHGARPGE